MTYTQHDTIVALSTPLGEGALGVIRLSGLLAIDIVDAFFTGKKKIKDQQSHTLHFGKIVVQDEIIDEVVVSVFKNPHSYTGEDVIEMSCHGSPFILKSIIDICQQHGARLAKPGEFTMRAFMNKKLDLSQAEAVGELIASDSAARHRTALNQLRGGIKNEIQELRNELIHAASLLELELDFSEEDVEFVSRADL
ncbi:MAG TPA: tRNA uridine-5-carboxymethylaminomethyl(34) synthesis GTPase MnmE, partial [Chitinophagaceae bacterium]|nr:tRNA uridine-5-carboxymethylaminomethyl(34) synthesis GTPase MnmE [Chitinophagaceae bacterium]